MYQDGSGEFLPSLFDDNFDLFQFDSIFRGDSEADMDNFFANLFSLPSFPRPSVDEPTAPVETWPHQLVHGYKSDAHVYVPVLIPGCGDHYLTLPLSCLTLC